MQLSYGVRSRASAMRSIREADYLTEEEKARLRREVQAMDEYDHEYDPMGPVLGRGRGEVPARQGD